MASLSGLVSQATAYTWSPLVNASRRAVLSLLSRISVGQLVIKDTATNVTTVCGSLEPRSSIEDLKHPNKTAVPSAELRVQQEMFWVRLVLFADMVRVNQSLEFDSLFWCRGLPKAIC
jgi:cyclopropane-fatty-acyl-phospholipid synthase